jgi:hypothetical protein
VFFVRRRLALFDSTITFNAQYQSCDQPGLSC